MRAVVLVKVVPDSYGERRLHLETGLVDRETDVVLDEISERALELALSLRDEREVEVVVLAMGPAAATAPIRQALAMGADRAVHVVDDELVGADMGLTAQVLASAVQRNGFDLVIAGDASSDGRGGVLPVMIAEMLGVPAMTLLDEVTVDDVQVTGSRRLEGETVELAASLPAVVSVTESFPAGRMPNFKGLMAAKKKQIETMGLVELGIEVLDRPRVILVDVEGIPARQAGTTDIDDGHAAERLADFLMTHRLV